MNSEPVRLAKVEKENKFDAFCTKIAPYVIFICIALLIMTIFVVLIKYGANLTGTESNIYYNGFKRGA